MKLDEMPIEKDIINILKNQEISELYPPQAEGLSHALNGDNLVLSIPTASGKSLVAYVTIVQKLVEKGGRALYVVPLRALAREKYDDLKNFEQLGLRVAMATGDLDESDPHLSRYDIIVCTSEKADSLLRHGVNWLSKIRVLVVDEIHLIHDPSRGPTLEVIISRFKALNPDTQIIALSATIQNAVELADWLDGKLVHSNWRPVPLKEGICYKKEIIFNDGSSKKIKNSETKPLDWLVVDSILDGGQVLIFVNNRRSTVSLAKNLSLLLEDKISEELKEKLKRLSSSLKQGSSESTPLGETLCLCIESGVAFHHAGLSSIQRRTIEQGYREHLIQCIVATPTLAAGVNIPARRVIIRDLWRYDSNFGMKPIPILEYKQQAGRAGRPQYDKEGEAITFAKTNDQKKKIFEKYVLGDTEAIFSKLGSQSALRIHLLSAIATQFVFDEDSIYKFIDSTFFAYQSNIHNLKDEIENAIDFLIDNGFIEQVGKRYLSTLFGKRTSSLYIDPLSAVTLRDFLDKTRDRDAFSLSYLHAICTTPDIRSLYLRRSDTWVEDKAEQMRDIFLISPPDPSSEEYEWFLSDLKTASLLEDWIDEVPEERIVSKYDIGPGDIHTLVEKAEWLLHATREFARTYNFDIVSYIGDLVVRMHNGCKKELLNLVSLRGIGRVRARALYNEGFKTINDLRNIPLERLANIKTIGRRMADSIKKQIGENEKMGYKELNEFYRR